MLCCTVQCRTPVGDRSFPQHMMKAFVNIFGLIVWVWQGSRCNIWSAVFNLNLSFITKPVLVFVQSFFMCHFSDRSSFIQSLWLEMCSLKWELQSPAMCLTRAQSMGGSIRGPLRLVRKLAICLSHSAHSPITCTDPLQATTVITPHDLWLWCDEQWYMWTLCRSWVFAYVCTPDVGFIAVFIFLLQEQLAEGLLPDPQTT